MTPISTIIAGDTSNVDNDTPYQPSSKVCDTMFKWYTGHVYIYIYIRTLYWTTYVLQHNIYVYKISVNTEYIYIDLDLEASLNRATPVPSSIPIGVSIINHPAIGDPPFLELNTSPVIGRRLSLGRSMVSNALWRDKLRSQPKWVPHVTWIEMAVFMLESGGFIARKFMEYLEDHPISQVVSQGS